LAIETDHKPDDDDFYAGWFIVDSIFNLVFLVEMLMRMFVEREKWMYNAWNVFDAILVAIGIVDVWILPLTDSNANMRFVTLLRLFKLAKLGRVLRVLRLMRNTKELILLISGIFGAMKAMIWGVVLLGIMIFISALLVTRLVGKQCCLGDDAFSGGADKLDHAPEDGSYTAEAIEGRKAEYEELWGTMPRSMFTLFQFTAEFQPDYVRTTWFDGFEGYIFTFWLIGYTLLSNIVILNIIASIIVEVIMSISASDREEEQAAEKEELMKEINEKVNDLFKNLDIDESKSLNTGELMDKKSEHVQKVFKTAGLAPTEATQLFQILDKDQTGTISPAEFRDGLTRLKRPSDPKDILRIEYNLGAVEAKVDQFIETQTKVVETLTRISGTKVV
jgi:Ca2+-binding EF-hand superfamily protein